MLVRLTAERERAAFTSERFTPQRVPVQQHRQFVRTLNLDAWCQQAFQQHQRPVSRPNIMFLKALEMSLFWRCFLKAAGWQYLECVRHEEKVVACSRFLCCSLSSCRLSLFFTLCAHTHGMSEVL